MMKRIALVTGANKGIGFEVALGLAKSGHHVLIGSRDVERGSFAAKKIRAAGASASAISIDVTDRKSVIASFNKVSAVYGRLDALINNAGILLDELTLPSQLSEEDLRKTFEVNFFGSVRVIQSFLPLLRRSAAGRIINVTSGLGSLTLTSDSTHLYSTLNSLAYCSSKAALNMMSVQFANELRGTTIKVVVVDPGYCATDINGCRGAKSPADGAKIILSALTAADAETATFRGEGGLVPW